MNVVRQWTGREATALRLARRASVRGFAEELDVGPRTVSNWSRFGASLVPRPDTQAILDTVLERCTPEQLERFHRELEDGVTSSSPLLTSVPSSLDYEQWDDDLDRAAVAVGRQSFNLAASLIERWSLRAAAHHRLDERALYLVARGRVLLGDVKRDQGALAGPGSALNAYAKGLEIFQELDIPRRAAQVELALAVVQEMSGAPEALNSSARAYRKFARDPRLDPRDQARARLWVGTALSKLSQYGPAIKIMTGAARQFEDLDEPEEWSIAFQKLALAHRGAGQLDHAQRLIEIAGNSRVDDSPMQQVRLRTAQAHILLTDSATRESGLHLLERYERLAMQYGLSHQQRAIANIRAGAR